MKKKYLLGILPALLVLSSCQAAPKENNLKEETLIEDTLAHDEIFGQGGEFKKLTPYKDPVVPSDPSLKKPVVGIQYKDDGEGKFAVRYVAAIADLDVEAHWTRSICNKSGVQQKTNNDKFVDKEVTTAYTAVSADSDSGDSITTPESVDPDFHYFVVYTLRGVPADHLDSYLFAFLTLEKGGETVSSKAIISKMDGGNSFAYDFDATTKYFLQGTINGAADAIEPIDDIPTGTNFAQKEGLELKADDNFGLFKVAADHFQCFGYDQLRRGAQFLPRVAAKNYIKASGNGEYNLYLTNTNEIHIVVPDSAKASAKLYFKPGDSWLASDPRYALYVFNDEAGTNDWIDLEEVGTSGIYSCVAFSAVTWPNCIFCRMDPGNATNDWAQKWSQTKNLNTDDAGNIFYVYNDASTDGAAKADGVWNLYLG